MLPDTDPQKPEYTWKEKLADVRRLLDWYEKEASAGTLAKLSNHGKLMVLRGVLLGEGGYED